MPRTARASLGGVCYHVFNRGNERSSVFFAAGDYVDFLSAMRDVSKRRPMRVFGYCLMPNHFHLALWPYGDGDLGRWMQSLFACHVRRHRLRYAGTGHIWQGRFKAFPIKDDDHLLTVLRYIERNPLRAGLVERAEDWRWSSLRHWARKCCLLPPDDGPLERPGNWIEWVNEAQTPAEEDSIRQSISRGAPFGDEAWVRTTAARLHLESSLHRVGRPRRVRREEDQAGASDGDERDSRETLDG
jgi:putative transposase